MKSESVEDAGNSTAPEPQFTSKRPKAPQYVPAIATQSLGLAVRSLDQLRPATPVTAPIGATPSAAKPQSGTPLYTSTTKAAEMQAEPAPIRKSSL